MFDEWKKQRELRRRINSLKERETISRARTDSNSPKYNPEAKLEVHGYEIGSLQRQLAELETDRLVRKARWLGVEIPQKEGWWWEDETFEGEVINGVYRGRFYLTEFGKVGVYKLIKEERRKSIDWWVKIITPILSALIALLGLIVAIISLSRK